MKNQLEIIRSVEKNLNNYIKPIKILCVDGTTKGAIEFRLNEYKKVEIIQVSGYDTFDCIAICDNDIIFLCKYNGGKL